MNSKKIEEELRDLGAKLKNHCIDTDRIFSEINSQTRNCSPTVNRAITLKILPISSSVAAALLLLALLIPAFRGTDASAAYQQSLNYFTQGSGFSVLQKHQVLSPSKKPPEYMRFSFQYPYYAKYEYCLSDGTYSNEITIENYNTRVQLNINANEKSAQYRSMTNDFYVNPKTGEIIETQIDYSLESQILQLSKWQAQNTKIIDKKKINGSPILIIQTQYDKALVTSWIEEDSKLPVHVEIADKNSLWTYSEITFSTTPNSSMMNMTPPDGYKIININQKYRTYQRGRTEAIMRYLFIPCMQYFSKNDDIMPEFLDNMADVTVPSHILSRLLDNNDTIEYHRAGEITNPGMQIIFYENPSTSDDGHLLCMFYDGHTEIITADLLQKLLK